MTRSGDWFWLFILLKLGQNMRDHETFILAKATCMASALHHSKSFYSVFFLYEGRGHLIILRFFQNFSRILSSLALRFSYFYIQCYDLYKKKKTWDPWHSVKKKTRKTKEIHVLQTCRSSHTKLSSQFSMSLQTQDVGHRTRVFIL